MTTNQLLAFTLNGQLFGIPLLSIKEVRTYAPPATLPKSSKWLLGVLNLRGDFIPVVALSDLLNIGEFAPTPTSFTIVAYVEGKTYGLAVDRVEDMVDVSEDAVHPVPGGSAEGSPVTGLLSHEMGTIQMLDINRLLPSLKG